MDEHYHLSFSQALTLQVRFYKMALEVKLVQKLSQSLLMTPQLQQAIKLLQLGRLEFKEAIEQEVLENPILEELKEREAQNGTEPELPLSLNDLGAEASANGNGEGNLKNSPIDWETYIDRFTDSRGSATPRGLNNHEDRPGFESSLTRENSLSEHLLSQLSLQQLSTAEKNIAFQIVGNLDKDGYLCSSYEEIATISACSLSEVEKMVDLIKSLDPPGIAARSLSECLLIQLDNIGLGEGLAARIVEHHLDKIEKRKYDLIAKQEQVAIDEVYKAITAIQSLEPRPGRPFSDETIRYIIPDIYVYKVDGEYVISLNEDGLPRLRISPYYLKVLQNEASADVSNRQYLIERLKAASWLIKSIHQRQQTIFRVTESIVKFQRDFLDRGVEKLKPLVLKQVADDIGMHESTVSRVTTNKYVHTPQGVFELKYFFTSGIKTASGDVSSSCIKEKVKTIIANEPPDKPISDQEIVELLEKENIKIARRTVAKYRETLGILSSSRRKRPF